MMHLTFYEVVIYFFIYGFIGWCAEVCFQALSKGKLVNRGFLNGALCPIYGVGVVIVIWFLEPLAPHGSILFVGSVILCSALEWVTGFILNKLFHQRWWDYSDQPFNIGGYICLKFSIMWGFACMFVVDIIHPTIAWLVSLVPHTLGVVFLCILALGFITDCAATVKTMIGLNKELKNIDQGAAKLRMVSDDITQTLYESSIKAKENAEKSKEENQQFKAKVKAERDSMESHKKELGKTLTYGQRRLLKAFPGMNSTRHIEAMEEMKSLLDQYTK